MSNEKPCCHDCGSDHVYTSSFGLRRDILLCPYCFDRRIEAGTLMEDTEEVKTQQEKMGASDDQ